MGFLSKVTDSVKKVVKDPVNLISPVTGAIKSATGLDWKSQLGIGAGIAGGGMLMNKFSPTGTPINGATGATGGSSSGGGVFRSMSNIFPSLIAGGASYLGAKEQSKATEQANVANVGLAREQMGFSAGQAQRQMDFQERMAGTSYQRAIADMKKAGINPMLAIDQGGAPSPSGGAGQPAGADIKPVPSVTMNSINSALNMVRVSSQARQADATASLAEKTGHLRGYESEGAKAVSRLWKTINSLLDNLGSQSRTNGKSGPPIKFKNQRFENESQRLWKKHR